MDRFEVSERGVGTGADPVMTRHKFSRHDFTLAELFACLVVREMMGKSYRRTEALLRDTDWCQQLGMTRVPDHATLCRAFAHILNRQRVGDMLGLFARVMRRAGERGHGHWPDFTRVGRLVGFFVCCGA